MSTAMFAIDLHVHSRFSGDNGSDPEESVLLAIERGLDGIAFTEHYSFAASEPVEPLREKYGRSIAIFRGTECSTAEGHCLVFGVNTDRLSVKYAPVEDLIRVVNGAGGVVIPSHPFRTGNSLGRRVRDLRGMCAIEGYNGCTMPAMNEMAVAEALLLGLPFTGGSDAHAPEEVGLCYTAFREPVTDDNFIAVLKGGDFRGIDTRRVSRGFLNVQRD